MASFGSLFSIDMSVMDFSGLFEGRIRVTSESSFKIIYGRNDYSEIHGDFNFNKKGQLIGGTVTDVDFGTGQYSLATLEDAGVGLKSLVKAAKTANTDDDAIIFGRIFSGDDHLAGANGSDTLRGLAGDDVLGSGFGKDDLDGGAGNDILNGGSDSDKLTGGTGADTFVYSNMFDSDEDSADTITDFSQADGDKIDLTGLGFFDFAEEIRVTQKNGYTLVEVDTMGGWNFPLMIRVTGSVGLGEADFIL